MQNFIFFSCTTEYIGNIVIYGCNNFQASMPSECLLFPTKKSKSLYESNHFFNLFTKISHGFVEFFVFFFFNFIFKITHREKKLLINTSHITCTSSLHLLKWLCSIGMKCNQVEIMPKIA